MGWKFWKKQKKQGRDDGLKIELKYLFPLLIQFKVSEGGEGFDLRVRTESVTDPAMGEHSGKHIVRYYTRWKGENWLEGGFESCMVRLKEGEG